jgi:hypothetical protein
VLARALLNVAISWWLLQRAGVDPWGQRRGLLIGRGAIGSAALLCVYAALAELPLAAATVLQYLYPTFTALLAWLMLGERIGARIVLAVLLGWGGVMLMARPVLGDPARRHVGHQECPLGPRRGIASRPRKAGDERGPLDAQRVGAPGRRIVADKTDFGFHPDQRCHLGALAADRRSGAADEGAQCREDRECRPPEGLIGGGPEREAQSRRGVSSGLHGTPSSPGSCRKPAVHGNRLHPFRTPGPGGSVGRVGGSPERGQDGFASRASFVTEFSWLARWRLLRFDPTLTPDSME